METLERSAERTLRDCIWDAIRDPGSVHPCPAGELADVKIWEVKPDGRCLWYSLVAASALGRGMEAEDLEAADVKGDIVQEARLLRKRVCRELEDESSGDIRDRYAPFWAAGEEGTEGANTGREYLQRLSKGIVFGGALELHALTQIAPCCIVVLNLPGGRTSSSLDRMYVSAHRSPDTPLITTPVMVLRHALHYDAAFFRAPRAHSVPHARSCDATRPAAHHAQFAPAKARLIRGATQRTWRGRSSSPSSRGRF